MNLRIRRSAGGALDDLVRAYEKVRDELFERLDSVDTKDVRRDALRLGKEAGKLRRRVEERVRPQPRRRFPLGPVLLLAGAIGIFYLLRDQKRREAVRERLSGGYEQARQRLPDSVSEAVDGVVGKVRGADPSRLLAEVESALGSLRETAKLEVQVEGRTVYLRGEVADHAVVAKAIAKAESVHGVVSVVDLTRRPAAHHATAATATKPVNSGTPNTRGQ